MTHIPDDIAEKVLSALREHGSLNPHAFLSGSSPTGSPFVLIKPEDTGQMWAIRIEGPWDASSDEGIAESSVALGFAVPNPEPSPIPATAEEISNERERRGLVGRNVATSNGSARKVVVVPTDLDRWHPSEITQWLSRYEENGTVSAADLDRARSAAARALGIEPDDAKEPATS